MRLPAKGSMIMPACRLVVGGPLDDVLATLTAVLARHGYRQRSRVGQTPLRFQRGSVASFALAGPRPRGAALYAVVTVQPTVLPDGDVHLALVQTRAYSHADATPVLRAAVAELAARFAAGGVLRFAGPLRPARDGLHLEPGTDGAEGYRGERRGPGAGDRWVP
ncbi:MAG: hypothetical protein JWP95_2227 [Actinotalea sp.]|jgi:hypothetical protein|nr:hypothetical protein [Actinotalea sp.]